MLTGSSKGSFEGGFVVVAMAKDLRKRPGKVRRRARTLSSERRSKQGMTTPKERTNLRDGTREKRLIGERKRSGIDLIPLFWWIVEAKRGQLIDDLAEKGDGSPPFFRERKRKHRTKERGELS